MQRLSRHFFHVLFLEFNQFIVLLFRNITGIEDSEASVDIFGFVLTSWSNCPKILSAKQDVLGTPLNLFLSNFVCLPSGKWSLYALQISKLTKAVVLNSFPHGRFWQFVYKENVRCTRLMFQRRRLLEIGQSETRIVCGDHVCQRIGMKCAIFIEDLP